MISQNKATNIIHHHLGMGDHIICNGLIRTKVDILGEVCLFAKEVNYNRVRRMYEDDPRICVVSIPNDANEYQYTDTYAKKNSANILRYGFSSHQNLNFDEVFYLQAEIPFEHRWKKFKIIRDQEKELKAFKKLNPLSEPYMFVHDDPLRGFVFDIPNPKNLKIIKNDPSICIFDMISLLEEAREIHCMESSFRCLIESFPSIICPLYFHKNVRSGPNPAYSSERKKWIVV